MLTRKSNTLHKEEPASSTLLNTEKKSNVKANMIYIFLNTKGGGTLEGPL